MRKSKHFYPKLQLKKKLFISRGFKWIWCIEFVYWRACTKFDTNLLCMYLFRSKNSNNRRIDVQVKFMQQIAFVFI